MIKTDINLTPQALKSDLNHFWNLSAQKIYSIEKSFNNGQGSAVYTTKGQYVTKGWTEWTQGFQYGSALLQFDATDEQEFLEIGRKNTIERMAPHISHIGVHDHGFNNLSTYGNLLRLMQEGRIENNKWEYDFYKLAIKISGSVQAARWTDISNGNGYIYSFNGPHSLFVDTLRSCRILVLAHKLKHYLQGEGDIRISLLERACKHILTTAHYSVFYGEGRDNYDEWGRTAHEIIFNINDGNYRCPNSQQGYSGFTTWTRGLAWAMVGFSEELEAFATIPDEEFQSTGGRTTIISSMEKAACAVCDFYIKNTPTDGIPYWDTGAPNLWKIGNYLQEPSNPYNSFEPIDSSAAAIGAQGLMRLGKYLNNDYYFKTGLTVLKALLNEPYLSSNPNHQGLLLHSIYHRPNNWDYIPQNAQIPNGESSMWGDYHIREAALYVTRLINNSTYYTFFNGY